LTAEMFPKLNIDFVTSALLSTDGYVFLCMATELQSRRSAESDVDRALPILVTEHEIVVERENAAALRRQASSKPATVLPAARCSDDALDSLKGGKVENVDGKARSSAPPVAPAVDNKSNSTQRSTADTSTTTATSANGVDAMDESRMEASTVLTGEAKYKKMEPIVRQLCDSFPHVPVSCVCAWCKRTEITSP
jgi:hypothetical protein